MTCLFFIWVDAVAGIYQPEFLAAHMISLETHSRSKNWVGEALLEWPNQSLTRLISVSSLTAQESKSYFAAHNERVQRS